MVYVSTEGRRRLTSSGWSALLVGAHRGALGKLRDDTQGSFDGNEAKGSLPVVERSGTEELAGITGSGAFAAPLGSTASVELDYDFE